MLLAIDVGNTNAVFAIHDGDSYIATWRCETIVGRTADEYYVWLTQLATRTGTPLEIDSVIVSSTVPRVVFNLRVLADRYFDCRPLVVGREDCALPIQTRVEAGVQVGPDRLANTVAAYDRYGGDVIVVDFGTATNFDVVDQDGAYIGGVISPGVNLSLEALDAGTAALPHVDVSQPEKVIGTNTVACIQSGVFWGYIGLIEGVCQKIREEHPRPMKTIGTGGLSTLFERGTTVLEEIDLGLTLHGLYLISKANQD